MFAIILMVVMEAAEWMEWTTVGASGLHRPTLRANVEAKHGVRGLVGDEALPSQLRCTWSPDKRNECNILLAKRLLLLQPGVPPRHLLFFGDSTMSILFGQTKSWPKLANGPAWDFSQCKCSVHSSNRCGLPHVYGFQASDVWLKPRPFKEGPSGYGLDNPGCQDCLGCHSQIQSFCPASQTPQCAGLVYASYFSVEFARDVEIQSTGGNTTQASIATFLSKKIATPGVCVVNTGVHDMAIINITDATYLENVEYYLRQLEKVCGHFVWIQTSAPATNDYLQKIERVKVWNQNVLHLLTTSFNSTATVVDIFDASRKAKHGDNVHLEIKFYRALAETLLSTVGPIDGWFSWLFGAQFFGAEILGRNHDY
jgi:hypothetical protein